MEQNFDIRFMLYCKQIKYINGKEEKLKENERRYNFSADCTHEAINYDLQADFIKIEIIISELFKMIKNMCSIDFHKFDLGMEIMEIKLTSAYEKMISLIHAILTGSVDLKKSFTELRREILKYEIVEIKDLLQKSDTYFRKFHDRNYVAHSGSANSHEFYFLYEAMGDSIRSNFEFDVNDINAATKINTLIDAALSINESFIERYIYLRGMETKILKWRLNRFKEMSEIIYNNKEILIDLKTNQIR